MKKLVLGLTVVWGVAGSVFADLGNYLVFDGTNEYVNVGNDASFDVGNTLTVEAWIKADDLSGRQGIFSTRFNNSAGAFQLEVGPGNGGSGRVAVTGYMTWVAESRDGAVSEGEWTHIAYVRSSVSDQVLYVNGVAQTLNSENTTYSFNDNTADKVIASGTSGGQFFDGCIAELRVWNVARSVSEVVADMETTLSGSESGLVAYYQFDEGSGSSVSDLSGNSNNGTLVNMEDEDWWPETFAYPPYLEITDPSSNTTVAGTQTEVTLRGTINAYVVNPVLWTNNANGACGSVIASETDFEIPGIPLDVYPNLITVSGMNEIGEVFSDSVLVTRAVSPALGIIDPVSPATVGCAADTVQICGTNNAYVTGQLVWTNAANGANGEVAVSGNDFETAEVPLAFGSNTVTVIGTNVLGVSAMDSLVIERDSTPALFISTPSTGTQFDLSTSAITVEGTNNQAVVGTILWTNAAGCTSGVIPVSETSFKISSIPIELGENAITVSGTNVFGQIIQDAISVEQVVVHLDESPDHYVATNGLSIWPYTNWVNAATVIQDALDSADEGDRVTVADGLYNQGGTVLSLLTNRVVVPDGVLLQSLNGPAVTIIEGAPDPVSGSVGDGAVRCVLLSEDAVGIAGFTLTNGYTRDGTSWWDTRGGGCFVSAYSDWPFVSNCLITACSAYKAGGGVMNGCVYHSTIQGCSALSTSSDGGGIYGGELHDSVVEDCVSAGDGGGAYWTVVSNSVIRDCFAERGGGLYYGEVYCSSISNCTAETGGGSCNISEAYESSFSKNAATNGGGAVSGYFYDCVFQANVAEESGGGGYGVLCCCCLLENNTAESGGGVFGSSVYGSTLLRNEACSGGGAYNCGLYWSELISNEADLGGGSYGDLSDEDQDSYTSFYDGCLCAYAGGCLYSNNLAAIGGGSYGYYVYSSLFVDHFAWLGGGSAYGELDGCTLSANTAYGNGAASYRDTVCSSILWDNSTEEAGESYDSVFSYSCTESLASGTGNISADPLFCDPSNGDFQIQSTSPCLDVGDPDTLLYYGYYWNYRPLDGNADGVSRVDMGCHEFLNVLADSDGDTMTDRWEQDYWLDPTVDNGADDSDGDAYSNLEEYIADTNPTNAADFFQILEVNGSNVIFDSSSNRWYTLYSTTNLVSGQWSAVSSQMGAGGTDSMSSTNEAPAEYFKLEVELP